MMRQSLLIAAAMSSLAASTGCNGGPCTYSDPMTAAMTISAIEPLADASVVAGERCETVQLSPTFSGIVRSTTATRGCLSSAGVAINSAVNVEFTRIRSGTCTPVIVRDQPAWIEDCARECDTAMVVRARDASASDAAQPDTDSGG